MSMRFHGTCLGGVASLLLLLAGCSGDRETGEPEAEAVTPTAPTAMEVLRRMTATYRDAISYQDRGVFRLRYRQQGKFLADEAPFSVRFSRPNRLHLEAYQVVLACDGRQLRARIMDPPSRNLGGQLLTVDAADEWQMDSLFQDPVIRESVVQGMGRHPLPLELLLADQPLQAIFESETEIQLLPSQSVEGAAC